MNWRNPFLITYLAVTVAGAAVLGYFVYSSYTRASEVNTSYEDAVGKLQRLQNKIPYPSAENNAKYVEATKEYRAEYDKLVAKAAARQRPLEAITPQGFQDRLRSDVSQVAAAASENNVTLPEEFYLGFDQYRGTLPPEAAAAPLARQLAAIRMIVDQLIQLKVGEIQGVKRDLLSQESGASRPGPQANRPPQGSGNRPPQGNRPPRGDDAPQQQVVNADSFEIAFVADQGAVRNALNFIANADQFFIIRSLSIQNSNQEGPKKMDEAAMAALSAPPADPSQPAAAPTSDTPSMRLLVGRESLAVTLRIEMITFNNLPTAQP